MVEAMVGQDRGTSERRQRNESDQLVYPGSCTLWKAECLRKQTNTTLADPPPTHGSKREKVPECRALILPPIPFSHAYPASHRRDRGQTTGIVRLLNWKNTCPGNMKTWI